MADVKSFAIGSTAELEADIAAMSRVQARKTLSLDDYGNDMRASGIYTSCVCADTLDEAPASYKGCDAIEEAIAPNAEIMARLKPVYNFKATS